MASIEFSGVVLIVGNYGSGKTEVSINLAVHSKRSGMNVRVADLDLVNPYFRTREAKRQLNQLGIDLVTPEDRYLQADLPILSPMIAGMIREPGELSIIDVGGDDAGATVLASLSDAFGGKSVHMLQVVNPFRPYTDTVDGCSQIRHAIEKAAKLRINGIVGNANLIEDTRVEHLYQGHDFVRRFADTSGLPLHFVTAPENLIPDLDHGRLSCPVLPIQRQLVPPWKKAVDITSKHDELPRSE